MSNFYKWGINAFQDITSQNSLSDEDNVQIDLDKLIGLKKVKETIEEIKAFCYIRTKRKDFGLKNDNIVLHMVFKGNPGTGKTTVARIMGKMFKEIGILEKGHVIEVDRSGLVGEYIGHTALKVRDNINKAMGGILFVDEAYSLARGGEKDFGKEAIDTLVKAMEDYKNQFILILAGYTQEMNYFMQMNPGLRSRFPIQIEFPDYSADELMAIAEKMYDDKQYRLAELSKKKLYHIITRRYIIDNGNARMIRNIVEASIMHHAKRVMNKKELIKNDLVLIEPADIQE